MRRSHRDIFITIKTEGALLPPDILQRIIDGNDELGGLTPDDYHLPKNERLNEAINRAWNRCMGVWRSFKEKVESLPDIDAGTTLTRENWLLILFQELGYGRLLTAKAKEINKKTYPISHAWLHTPIHLVSFRQDLDRRTPGMAGAARMSPYSLVQEFLNQSEEHLWGMVSNGLKLRLLRDNLSLTRQAFLEFDLDAMMSGEVYSDFVLLFMLLHQSRVEAEKPERCLLERWSQEAQKRGTRALDQLREGVERAIESLGKGFLAHPANNELQKDLQSGALSTHDLYQEILRLVYRMIFLFVAEDRDLLIPRSAPPEACRRYMEFYSLSRIRRIAGSLKGTRHYDLWQGLKITFQCLAKGEPYLGITPLGGFLFSKEALQHLNECEIANEFLLKAVRQLSFTKERRILRPVDYRNSGTEELGSVYESLLELHPAVNVDASIFELKGAAGSERKTTGSYYTPTSLITCLLDSALQPLIDKALKQPDPERALLDLKVVDPACGSGHFLIAAAHRIGKHLAMVRTGETEPPPEERRAALCDVVSRCIYGVDVNPLAVELCKVALWIETLDPGRPLGFLDHHIKCGNSLIGTTPELMEKGIPDDAFKPLIMDNPAIAREVRENNKRQRKGVRSIFTAVKPLPKWQKAVKDLEDIVALPETGAQHVREKAELYEVFRKDEAYRHQCQVANLWTAAFFWPLTNETITTVPTEDLFRSFQQGGCSLKEEVQKGMEALATQHRFFHWHLEFPEVFTDEKKWGFDCVLGNPPWERIKLQEKEFFAQRDPDIANAPNAAARKRLIGQLKEKNLSFFRKFIEAKNFLECETHFFRFSKKYPLTAVGDINTYQIFAGLVRQLICQNGYAGIVLPTGIATDDSNKFFFQDLLKNQSLVSLYDFKNRKKIFPAVKGNIKFCLFTITKMKKDHFIVAAQLDDTSSLLEQTRKYELTLHDISVINPNTLNCPMFSSQKDAKLVKAVHQRVPILIDKKKDRINNSWDIEFMTMFHMANDSHLFRSFEELQTDGWNLQGNQFQKENEKYLPLYEAKLINQFNHRAGTFDGVPRLDRFKVHAGTKCLSIANLADPNFVILPRYWIHESEIYSRVSNDQKWFLGFRNTISSIADSRSFVASIIPFSGIGHSMPIVKNSIDPFKTSLFMCLMNSFILDYILRQKASGGNLKFYILKQLPFISIEEFNKINISLYDKTLEHFVLSHFIELVYTSWDLNTFASDFGYNNPPFRWDEERRFKIRCELDALFFHLYKINRDDIEYILENFPIIKRKDIAKFGEYRTKRIIIECYDAMQQAKNTNKPYQTILDPVPADRRITHLQNT